MRACISLETRATSVLVSSRALSTAINRAVDVLATCVSIKYSWEPIAVVRLATSSPRSRPRPLERLSKRVLVCARGSEARGLASAGQLKCQFDRRRQHVHLLLQFRGLSPTETVYAFPTSAPSPLPQPLSRRAPQRDEEPLKLPHALLAAGDSSPSSAIIWFTRFMPCRFDVSAS